MLGTACDGGRLSKVLVWYGFDTRSMKVTWPLSTEVCRLRPYREVTRDGGTYELLKYCRVVREGVHGRHDDEGLVGAEVVLHEARDHEIAGARVAVFDEEP